MKDGRQKEIERRWYKRLPGGKTQCHICPLNCVLDEGQTCYCRTRQNVGGRLMTNAYGNPCIISVDPIEKLPLAHYLPEKKSLSVAFGGCNLRCLYCQNWKESQSKPGSLRTFPLETAEAVQGAGEQQCGMIAYTYTEPVAFYEYMYDTAVAARIKNIKNVCATALSINPEPLKSLCKVMDAFSVSLKGFDEKFYVKVLGVKLAPVLQALETIKNEGPWLEIVNLVVPTYNDDFKGIKKMCKWIEANLGKDTPVHFGRFVPMYKLRNLPRTPVRTLEKCREIAMESGLKFAYIFNVSPHEGNYTYCPDCGSVLVKRLGFKVIENNIKDSRCFRCSEKIPGVWS